MLKHMKMLRERVAIIGVASAVAFTPVVISPVIAQTLQPEQNDTMQIIEEDQNDLQNDENAVNEENSDATGQSVVEENQLDGNAPANDGVATDNNAAGSDMDSLSQDDGAASPEDSLANDSDATGSVDGVDPVTSSAISTESGEMYVLEQADDQVLANHYIGKSVYNDAKEKVGDIRDLVFSKEGGIQAAVIGVGGFLGLGEKQVAVSFDQIRIEENPENAELELYIAANKDQLAEAPEFTTKEDKLAEATSGDAVTDPAQPANPMAPASPAQPTE